MFGGERDAGVLDDMWTLKGLDGSEPYRWGKICYVDEGMPLLMAAASSASYILTQPLAPPPECNWYAAASMGSCTLLQVEAPAPILAHTSKLPFYTCRTGT